MSCHCLLQPKRGHRRCKNTKTFPKRSLSKRKTSKKRYFACNLRFYTYLFQQLSAIIVILQYLHLLYGNLIKLDEPFRLRDALVDKHNVEVLHIRETDKFVDGGIVTDIALQLGNSFTLILKLFKPDWFLIVANSP